MFKKRFRKQLNLKEVTEETHEFAQWVERVTVEECRAPKPKSSYDIYYNHIIFHYLFKDKCTAKQVNDLWLTMKEIGENNPDFEFSYGMASQQRSIFEIGFSDNTFSIHLTLYKTR